MTRSLVPPDVLAAARTGAATSLEVFRAVLHAAAQPGMVMRFPKSFGGSPIPTAVRPLLTLCDLEVTFAIAAEDEVASRADMWTEAVRATTGANPVAVDRAQWVAILDGPPDGVLTSLVRGTAVSPEAGARVVVTCGAVWTDDQARPDWAFHPAASLSRIELTGPGIPGARQLDVLGLPESFFAERATANRDFPAGIDIWLVTSDGRVIGLPRSSRISVLATTAKGPG